MFFFERIEAIRIVDKVERDEVTVGYFVKVKNGEYTFHPTQTALTDFELASIYGRLVRENGKLSKLGTKATPNSGKGKEDGCD